MKPESRKTGKRRRKGIGLEAYSESDRIIEALMPGLRERGSWFADPDFPYAETWWWNYSALEISHDRLLENLSGMAGR